MFCQNALGDDKNNRLLDGLPITQWLKVIYSVIILKNQFSRDITTLEGINQP